MSAAFVVPRMSDPNCFFAVAGNPCNASGWAVARGASAGGAGRPWTTDFGLGGESEATPPDKRVFPVKADLGLGGFEPPTSRSRTERASPCATARKKRPLTGPETGATGIEPATSGLTGRRDKPTSPRPLRETEI